MLSGSCVLGGSVLGPRRLLIAGDVALSRALIEMVLSRLGYTVTCVASGQQALAALERRRFALALVALGLPDLDGLALAGRMRGAPAPTGRVPIMLFGEVQDARAMLATCRAAGLQGFMPKPISIGRLVSSVCDIVRATASAGSSFMTMAENETLALDRLHEFTGGDEQLERELLTLFFATSGHYLAELRGQLERPEAWRHTAHALKGASANIGARRLHALAEAAEHGGPAPARLAGLEEALEEIRRLCRERWAAGPSPAGDALARSS